MCVTKAWTGIGVLGNSIQFYNWTGLCMPANSSCTPVMHGSKAKYTSELEGPNMVETL